MPNPLQILAASVWEIGLTGAVSVIGGLMTVLWYFFRRRLDALDRHIEDCNQRGIATAASQAAVEQRLTTVESEVKGLRRTGAWIGDCVVGIGSKLGVEIPPRPE